MNGPRATLTAATLAIAVACGCAGSRDEISLALENAGGSSPFDLATDRSRVPRVTGTARLEVLLPATPLRGAGGIACHDGKIHVAELLMNRLSTVAPDGAVTRVATPHGFGRPVDLVFDKRQHLYVASEEPGGLWHRAPTGTWDRILPQLGPLGGISLGTDGRLWAAECARGGRLLEISAEQGSILGEYAEGLGCPGRIHVEKDGRLLVPFPEKGEVLVLDPSTATTTVLARGLDIPTAAGRTPEGQRVVLESGTGRIAPLASEGGSTTPATLVRLTPGIADLVLCGNTLVVSNALTGALEAFKPWPRGKRTLAPAGLVLASAILTDGADLIIADQVSLKRLRHDRLELVVPSRFDGMSSAVGLTGGLPGLVWVTSPEKGELLRVDLNRGEASRIVVGLSWPTSVLRTPTGELLIAETGAGRIVTVGLGAIPYTLGSGLLSPVGLAMRGQRILTVEPSGGRMLSIRPNEPPAIVQAGLAGPAGLATERRRPVYIAEERKGKILARARDGSLRAVAEGLALKTPHSRYPLPVALAIGPAGEIFVASPENGSLLRIVPN